MFESVFLGVGMGLSVSHHMSYSVTIDTKRLYMLEWIDGVDFNRKAAPDPLENVGKYYDSCTFLVF